MMATTPIEITALSVHRVRPRRPQVTDRQGKQPALVASSKMSEAATERFGDDRPMRVLLTPLLRPRRGALIVISAAAVSAGFAEAAVLVLIARIAFALTSPEQSVDVDLGPLGETSFSVGSLLIFATALVLLRVVLQVVYTVAATRVAYGAIESMRTSLIDQYLATGWPVQAAQREGRLQDLLTTYADAGANAVGSVTAGIIGVFNLSALLITALWVSPVASVVATVFALGIGLMLRPLRAAVRRRSGRTAQANLDFATGLTELTSTLQEVRIFGVEQQVSAKLRELNRRNVRAGVRTGYVGGSIGILYQGTALLLIVGALAVAYASGLSELASLGAIVLIILRSLSYAQSVQSSLQDLSLRAPYLQTLAAEQERYLAARPRVGREPVGHIGSIRFDHVSFEYEPGIAVLHDITFDVPRGEVIGIVGPSGSGKSTLMQLLLRLREPTTGSVLADGRDVRGMVLEEWFERVTFVPQEPHLFAGTVAENIRFFRDIDDSSVERASRRAHIHDDIAAWSRGYDTPVGERGGELSGGQRQRICIARALVGDPEVMVLDEPTSSLDVRSDALIRETISAVPSGTTVFVVAHRLSTLAICNRIMVVLDGRLEGFDEPAELERSNPFYSEALRLSGMR
jgi:ATP-binding cassette subfamily B protein